MRVYAKSLTPFFLFRTFLGTYIQPEIPRRGDHRRERVRGFIHAPSVSCGVKYNDVLPRDVPRGVEIIDKKGERSPIDLVRATLSEKPYLIRGLYNYFHMCFPGRETFA